MLIAQKHSSLFSNILSKEKNAIHIKREPFLNLREEELQSFSFSKTPIESWNYTKTLDALLEERKGTQHTKFSRLIEDIKELLAECYSLSDDYEPHEVSLSAVRGVPCTKFHADFLPLRMICTYYGAGTIFLPQESTRYPCLNEGRPNKRVVIKDKPINQANPFDVLLLKGRKFNKGELRPCAHRSPESDGLRLVLKIDFK